MLGISDISQVNIDNIRAANDVTVSMKVPIGINNKGEEVFLDLHQKGDGPNGLIVGPTGSGKSEFLLTLSLSLCLFFSSKEVRIHVIDLKGGRSCARIGGPSTSRDLFITGIRCFCRRIYVCY